MKQLKTLLAVLLFLAGVTTSVMAQTATLAQYMQAGNTAYGAKNYDLAIQYYQAVVNLSPNYGPAYQGLGNCYYFKGDNSNALTNYQKALNLDPNNASLSSFVQSLKAKVGATTTATAATSPVAANSSSAIKPAKALKTFEISVMGGVAVAGGLSYPATLSAPATTIDAGLGIGGGVEGYCLLDKNLGVGLVFDYFLYSTSTSQAVTAFNSSSQQTVGTLTSSQGVNLMELMPSIKYKFDGSSFRPYVVGSIGFCFASTSSSGSLGSWSNGVPPGATTGSATAAGPSYSGPMAQVGLGGEFSLGDTMNLFLQGKYNMVFAGNTTFQGFTYQGFTFSSIPIEAGVNFDF